MPAERIVVDGLGRLPQFAHAGQAGDSLFVSGTLGTVEGLDLADGIGAQTTQTLENMGRILESAGATWDDVAKVSVFMVDMAEFGAMNQAYSDYFGDGTPPARITVGGCDLALGGRVEMECIADRPRDRTATSSTRTISRRTLTVEHDGEALFVEVAGDEHRDRRPPLVLSHGLGGNHAIWFQQVNHFARDRMVVTWDHRGFGNSTDRAGRSGPDVAAGDLLAICDHLGLGHPDLVGQSMGGWTVVGAELLRHGFARSIVMADSHGGFTSDGIAAGFAAPRRVEATGTSLDTLGLHPAIDASLRERDPARAYLYQLIGDFGTIDTGTLMERLLATTHDAGEASSIDCPVLCLVGERDPLIPPAVVRGLADMLSDARFVEVPGAGHSPYFEDPELWNVLVERFLGTNDG
ncbi:MAG: alpha/beta fold hydrolase [Acidimicrobiales bacterium]|nr:alpha/beta fold hydrolase [Acidimicrobiales bacterium]